MITNITTPCGLGHVTTINVGIPSGLLVPAIVADGGAYVMQVAPSSTGEYVPFIGWFYGPNGFVQNVDDATHFGGGVTPPVNTFDLLVNSLGDKLIINAAGDFLNYGTGVPPVVSSTLLINVSGNRLIINGAGDHLIFQ